MRCDLLYILVDGDGEMPNFSLWERSDAMLLKLLSNRPIDDLFLSGDLSSLHSYRAERTEELMIPLYE